MAITCITVEARLADFRVQIWKQLMGAPGEGTVDLDY